MKPIIGITMGDPAGIGPEVVVKAVTDGRIRRACRPLIFGSYPVILSAVGRFSRRTPVRRIVWAQQAGESEESINVLDCTKLEHTRVRTGKITKTSGRMAADCLFCAVQFALSDQIDAVVTAPLSKKGLKLAGYDFPGHTELLAHLTATSRYAMMFFSRRYKVVLVTTHLPLSKVAPAISKSAIVDKLILAGEALRTYFGVREPRIGVCGLNPHCGEEGILGSEERQIIIPSIRAAQGKGIKVQGPFSSDTIFSPRLSAGLDCILAMYHDQGLIPLKMGELGAAVNVTIGLPIIRTSPDFGTALDIAGKGLADPRGMINAIFLAAKMVREKEKRSRRPL